MTPTKQRRLFGISILIFVILMLIATFWDRQISNLLINHRSIFGTVFQTFGLFPPYLILIVSGQIALTYALRGQINPFFGWIFGLGGMGLSGWTLKTYLDHVENYIVSIQTNLIYHKPIGLANNDRQTLTFSRGQAYLTWIVTFIVITILFQYWLKRYGLKTIKKLILVAVFACLTVGFTYLVNMGLKDIWGRVRPYELNNSQSNFTNWLTINGINGHHSFPSGHAKSAALLIVFSWFFKGKARLIWWIIGVVYGVLMCLSRIVIGAHFASDVIFSFFLTALIVYIARMIYLSVIGRQEKN